MDFLGIHLTLLIGPSVPLPAPVDLMEALEEVEVHTGDDRSGFQIRFQVGRCGPADLLDYALLASPLLQTWNRVILIVTFNATPRVLMDGFVTQREFSASNEPGRSFITLTGDDVSVKLDLEEKSAEHVGEGSLTGVFGHDSSPFALSSVRPSEASASSPGRSGRPGMPRCSTGSAASGGASSRCARWAGSGS